MSIRNPCLAAVLILLPTVAFGQTVLAPETVITKIAFGSCAKQDQPQPIWEAICETKPDVFLFLGDNIYGDSDDATVLKNKWKQLGDQPGYKKLLETCQVLATWDDHDYGKNDAGVEFPIKRESQTVFLDFFNVAQDDLRRNQEGVYFERTFGPKGKRVQIIMLDTRYFRSPMTKHDVKRFKPEGIRGPYGPTKDRSTTVLGETQWKWLEEQLRKPADVRIIGSSIQLISNQHGWEKWGNFPHERTRFFQLIRDCKANGAIVLSGDRHLAEIALINDDNTLSAGYPIYEVTSSSLNSPSNNFTKSGTRFANELNSHRVGLTYFDINFGLIEIDWDQPALRLQVRDGAGGIVLQQRLDTRKLVPPVIP